MSTVNQNVLELFLVLLTISTFIDVFLDVSNLLSDICTRSFNTKSKYDLRFFHVATYFIDINQYE
jgi:hypothetical protein